MLCLPGKRFISLWLSLLCILGVNQILAQEKVVKAFNKITDVLSVDPNDINTLAAVEGLLFSGDGGGAIFRYYSTSTTATNDISVFKPYNYPGRWIRVIFGDGGDAQFGSAVYATIGEMVASQPSTTFTNAFVLGYYQPNDLGGGQFIWFANNTSQTNYGTIFASSVASGRWIRQYDGPLNVRHFGALDSLANNSVQIQSAIDFGSLTAKDIYFPPSTNRYNCGNLIARNNTRIHGPADVVIVPGSTNWLTVSNVVNVVVSDLTIYIASEDQVGIWDTNDAHDTAYNNVFITGFLIWGNRGVWAGNGPYGWVINRSYINSWVNCSSEFVGTHVWLNNDNAHRDNFVNCSFKNANRQCILSSITGHSVGFVNCDIEGAPRFVNATDSKLTFDICYFEAHSGPYGLHGDGNSILTFRDCYMNDTYVSWAGTASASSLMLENNEWDGIGSSSNSPFIRYTADVIGRLRLVSNNSQFAVVIYRSGQWWNGSVWSNLTNNEEEILDHNLIYDPTFGALSRFHSSGPFLDGHRFRQQVGIDGDLGVGTLFPDTFSPLEFGRSITIFSPDISIAGLEMRGYRTNSISDFAALKFDLDTNTVAYITAYKDGADDAGGLRFLTKATGSPLAEVVRFDSDGFVQLPLVTPLSVLRLRNDQRIGVVAIGGGLTWDGVTLDVATNSGSFSGYANMYYDSIMLTVRTNFNLYGPTLIAVDNAASNRTDISIDADVNAIASNSGTGFWSRSGSGTGNSRTITATSPISVLNGDGVSGNPLISFSLTNLMVMPTIPVTAGAIPFALGADGTNYQTSARFRYDESFGNEFLNIGPSDVSSSFASLVIVNTNNGASVPGGATMWLESINDSTGESGLSLRRGRGIPGAITPALNGNQIGIINFDAFNSSSSTRTVSSIVSTSTQDQGATSGAKLEFFTIANGSTTPTIRFALKEDGIPDLYAVSNPTTDDTGEIAFSSDSYGAGRGTFEIFDGTASANVVATQASDVATANQAPVYDGVKVMWELVPVNGLDGGYRSKALVDNVSTPFVTFTLNGNLTGGSAFIEGNVIAITAAGSICTKNFTESVSMGRIDVDGGMTANTELIQTSGNDAFCPGMFDLVIQDLIGSYGSGSSASIEISAQSCANAMCDPAILSSLTVFFKVRTQGPISTSFPP